MADSTGITLADEALARRARGGDRACFEELVRRYQVPLLRFLQRRGWKLHEAEDVLQEAFLKAYRSLNLYRDGLAFRTWMFTLTWRLAISEARRRRPSGDTGDIATASSNQLAPSEGLERQESRENLWQTARALLTDEQFAALWLHYGQSMPAREIGHVLGRSWVWVKTALYRARRRLQEHLEPAPANPSHSHPLGPLPMIVRGET